MLDQQCLPRETLKRYLAGWSDPDQSDWIETHLAACGDCEQTIVALESDPDTLVEFVRSGYESSHGLSAPQAPDATSAPVAEALLRARSLNDSQSSPSTSIAGENWQPPSSDIGAYELLRSLGSGGMGSVFLARHRKLGKEVAIKLLPVRNLRSEFFAARFEREIRAAGGLDHPSIVRATDAGEFEGTHYLVMEHIDGLDLSRIAKLTGKLSVADACEVVRQVAQGLSHAHSNGIIHRDIKPSNLMLSRSGEAKVLDFGLARVGPWDEVSAELTTVGQLMGTLDYMAPEQAERAESVDYRADLYSLGATLFRLLCGRAPLAASPDLSPLAKLRLLATHEAPKLDAIRPDAPEKLVVLISDLLARDPADRPASADHVAERLAEFTVGHQLANLTQNALLAQETEPEPQSVVPPVNAFPQLATQNNISKSDRRIRWLALAMLPLLIWAGIWIALETQKGVLVIRSEAEASVRLLQNGKVYQQVQVVPGANSTRVYAGKYEVELAAGSDSLKLHEDRITIVRGGTEIASIQSKAAAEGNSTEVGEESLLLASGTASSDGIEPLYENKPLSVYLEMLARERSPAGLGDAFAAIKALLTPQTAERITESLLTVLPTIDGELRVVEGEGESKSIYDVDHGGFVILHSANPGKEYSDCLLRQLAEASPEWEKRLLFKGAIWLEPGHRIPFINWLAKNVLSNRSHVYHRIAKQVCVRWRYFDESSDDENVRLDEILRTDRIFDREFWLSQVVETRYEEPRYDAVFDRVKPVCISTLQDSGASERSLAQSLIHLNILHSKELLSHAEKAAIAREIHRLLASLEIDRIVELVEVAEGFARDSYGIAPPFGAQSLSGVSGAKRSWRVIMQLGGSLPKTSLVGQLLSLAASLQLKEYKAAQDVADATEDDYRFVAEIVQGLPTNLVLSWPKLSIDMDSRNNIYNFSNRIASYKGRNFLAELSKVNPDQWLAYFLHRQAQALLAQDETDAASEGAAIQPARKNGAAAIVPPSRTRSSQRSPQARSDGSTSNERILFKGRPIDEWIRITPLEKSEQGIEEALTALASLASEDTDDLIYAMLEEQLPIVGWTNLDHNRKGLRIMRGVDSDRYLEFVLDQLESTDNEQWRENLLLTCISPTNEFDEIRPIHEWIVKTVLENRGHPFFDGVAKMYRKLVNSSPASESLENALTEALVNCDHLDDGFWYDTSLHFVQSKVWMEAVRDRLELTLENPESSSVAVIRAAVKVVEVFGVRHVRDAIAEKWSEYFDLQRIEKAVELRLEKLLAESSLLSFHKVGRASVKRYPTSMLDKSVFYLWGIPKSRTVEAADEVLELEALLSLIHRRDRQLQGRNRLVQVKPESKLHELLRAVASRQVDTIAGFWAKLHQQGEINLWARQSILESRLETIISNNRVLSPLTEDSFNDKVFSKNQFFAALIYCRANAAIGNLNDSELMSPIILRSKQNVIKSMIETQDKDQSGSLDYAEFKGFASLLKDSFWRGGVLPESFVAELLDANGDERVDSSEVYAFMEAEKEKELEAQKVGASYRLWAEKQISRYDRDHDGVLQRDEWQRMLVKPEGADANQDGVIDVDEYSAFRVLRK